MAGAVFGLATSTKMSKKLPVAPSARNQLSAGAVDRRAVVCAAPQLVPGHVHRPLDDHRDAVDRSMAAETSVFSSPGIWSMFNVKRCPGATV